MASKPDLFQYIERELEKNREISSAELFEGAKKAYPEVRKMTLRQFHARYPLQVKRRIARAEGRGRQPGPRRGSKRKSRLDRDAARKVLISLAENVASANGSAELIGVIAHLDSYLDELEKAVG